MSSVAIGCFIFEKVLKIKFLCKHGHLIFNSRIEFKLLLTIIILIIETYIAHFSCRTWSNALYNLIKCLKINEIQEQLKLKINKGKIFLTLITK